MSCARLALAAASLSLALPALAQPAQLPAVETSATGYLDARSTVQSVRTDALVPPDDVPQLSTIEEANLQLRLRWGEQGIVYSDLSLFFQAGRLYQDRYGTELAEHDVATLRPGAVISELYGILNLGEHANLTVGKKRIVWGSGLAANPTDLLNPPKDPTDPTFQRAGAWLARLELPFERFTLSFVGAAQVLRQYGGVPTALLVYPTYPSAEARAGLVPDDRDHAPHFMTAARAYALVANTDVNVFYFFGNRYNDAFDHSSRGGASFSRVVWGGLEAHAEALLQAGSPRLYADDGCAQGRAALLACVRAGRQPIGYSQLDDGKLRPKALLGLRYLFEGNAQLSAEYLYDSTGYTDAEFQAYVSLLGLGAGPQLGATSDPGSPQKFVFEPLRRHYLFLSFLHPTLADDFSVSVVAFANLEDFSGQLAPSVTWNVRQWLALTLGGFAPIPGVESRGAQYGGRGITEYTFSPAGPRAYFAIRGYY